MITVSRNWPCSTYWCLIGIRARVICRTWHLHLLNIVSWNKSCAKFVKWVSRLENSWLNHYNIRLTGPGCPKKEGNLQQELKCAAHCVTTGTDRNGPTKIPKRTCLGTKMDRNGLKWVPKRTGTDFSSYRNKLQWEPEKVGWGTIEIGR